MAQLDWHISLTVGLLLSAALIAGRAAQFCRLPKVTAYLLVGLLLGPHTVQSLPPALVSVIPASWLELTTIPEAHMGTLHAVGKLAVALVLFNMGCGFSLASFRNRLGRIVLLSAAELAATFGFVALGMLVLGEAWPAALLLAALALATAPATTILVLKENRAEGPLTRHLNALVALNNLACVVVFEVLLTGILLLEGQEVVSLSSQLGRLAGRLLGSVALGLLAGIVVSLGCALLARRSWLVLLIAASTLILGLSQRWELPYLLTFLVMGTTVANVSHAAKDIVAQWDELTGLLCVVFFVIHGAELDVRALIAAGWTGVAYILLRGAGKYTGVYFAVARRDGRQMRRWLGAALMSQAGAAIALSSLAAERHPALGEHLLQIILGTVVFFELIGPLLIRQAVIRSGEVPVGELVHHAATTPAGELGSMVNRFLMAIGADPWRARELGDLRVSDVMRQDTESIPASATFHAVLDFLRRSHDNCLPVVDGDGAVVGIIRYLDLQGEHFDPELGSLACAEDLALSSFPQLHPDEHLLQAWKQFQSWNDDCLPVVTAEKPQRLLGIVRRHDVLRFIPREGRRP